MSIHIQIDAEVLNIGNGPLSDSRRTNDAHAPAWLSPEEVEHQLIIYGGRRAVT